MPMSNHLDQKILDYFNEMKGNWKLPKGVSLIYPFDQADTLEAMSVFYRKYYGDSKPRKLIMGINPGRLGAGVTGIPFTDPIHLKEHCGIDNPFKKKHELSSIYVFTLIESMGGPLEFFSNYYISSTCPLGFTKDGINYNYYDDPKLFKAVKPYIVRYIEQQINFGLTVDRVFCWGKGKNYKFLNKLNEEYKWFDEIVPQPHPRWIMQYRRKTMEVWKDQMVAELLNV